MKQISFVTSKYTTHRGKNKLLSQSLECSMHCVVTKARQPVHRSSIFSFEIVERAYENKNRGRFIHHMRGGVGLYRPAFAFARCQTVEEIEKCLGQAIRAKNKIRKSFVYLSKL